MRRLTAALVAAGAIASLTFLTPIYEVYGATPPSSQTIKAYTSAELPTLAGMHRINATAVVRILKYSKYIGLDQPEVVLATTAANCVTSSGLAEAAAYIGRSGGAVVLIASQNGVHGLSSSLFRCAGRLIYNEANGGPGAAVPTYGCFSYSKFTFERLLNSNFETMIYSDTYYELYVATSPSLVTSIKNASSNFVGTYRTSSGSQIRKSVTPLSECS